MSTVDILIILYINVILSHDSFAIYFVIVQGIIRSLWLVPLVKLWWENISQHYDLDFIAINVHICYFPTTNSDIQT